VRAESEGTMRVFVAGSGSLKSGEEYFYLMQLGYREPQLELQLNGFLGNQTEKLKPSATDCSHDEDEFPRFSVCFDGSSKGEFAIFDSQLPVSNGYSKYIHTQRFELWLQTLL